MYKKSTSFTSTLHGDTTLAVSINHSVYRNTSRLWEEWIWRIKKLQPYKHDRSTKWYTKPFKRPLNISVHNAFVLSRESQSGKELHHLVFRLTVMKELFEVHSKVFEPLRPGWPLKALTHATLIGHSAERIPTSEKQAKHMKRHAVCCTTSGGEKEGTSFLCKDCGRGSCLEDSKTTTLKPLCNSKYGNIL
jgi:hypothetical protein